MMVIFTLLALEEYFDLLAYLINAKNFVCLNVILFTR